ncbi:MAG: AmmeMemoRadiSam system protein B [Spirochaetales bacterium]|nr:AmmeMemoRadiSam system protein B [Spirochaetales bacterium]
MSRILSEHYSMIKVREPIVEGIFYPSDRQKLKRLVTSLLATAPPTGGSAWGILSPHAGYRYSGAIAAAAYSAARDRKVKTAVILAPLHRTEKDEVILPESEKFKIPLGLLDVDRRAVDELVSFSTRFVKDDIPHLEEHSIEVQLPFLPVLFPGAAIVPVLVGRIGRKTVAALANALEIIFGKRSDSTLFIVSANLTSFMQGGAAKTEAETFIRLILEGDTEGLLSSFEEGTINSCGVPALAALMLLAGTSCDRRLLSSGNSAEVNRDYRELVHYAAVGFFKNKA